MISGKWSIIPWQTRLIILQHTGTMSRFSGDYDESRSFLSPKR